MEEIIVIYINNENDEEEYLIEQQFQVHKKIYNGVKHSFKYGINTLHIFKIINNLRGYTAILTVDRDNWVISLEKCLKYFLDVEEYELCDKVTKLLNKIKNGDI